MPWIIRSKKIGVNKCFDKKIPEQFVYVQRCGAAAALQGKLLQFARLFVNKTASYWYNQNIYHFSIRSKQPGEYDNENKDTQKQKSVMAFYCVAALGIS